MSRTRAEFRQWLREALGDEIRVQGTAASGAVDNLVDETLLTQLDGYWDHYMLNVLTTTDTKAPQGESREVILFDGNAHKLTTEPFTAAIGTGDTYSIAFFADAELNAILNDAIRAISRIKPQYTTASLSAVIGKKRYDYPTGALRIDRIAHIDTANQADTEYAFSVERHGKQIVFPGYWTEAKTLTVFLTAEHDLLAADDGVTTVPDVEEEAVKCYAQAQAILKLRSQRFESAKELQPIEYAEGQVRVSGGTAQQWLQKLYQDLMESFEQVLGVKGAAPYVSVATPPKAMAVEARDYLRA